MATVAKDSKLKVENRSWPRRQCQKALMKMFYLIRNMLRQPQTAKKLITFWSKKPGHFYSRNFVEMSDKDVNIEDIKRAIFKLFERRTSFEQLAKTFNVSKMSLNRYYDIWSLNAPESQPHCSDEIHITIPKKGHKIILSEDDENITTGAVLYYSANLTPFARSAVI